MRIWIDTDIGSDVDDALTLAYVIRHSGFELAGVSTVFGDVDLRSAIADSLLKTAQAPEVPIVTGLGAPLTPGRHGLMFGHEGRGIVENPEPRRRTEPEPDADARVARLAKALERAEPDVLLAIGPLSNLAALLRAGHSLPPLAIMGGKLSDVEIPGMIQGISEWNWFCDPVATRLVVESPHGQLPRVVPAEVTFKTCLEDGDVEVLAGGDPLARQLATLCEIWLDSLRPHVDPKSPRVVLHDPLTAAVLVRDDFCPFEALRIELDDQAKAEVVPGEPNILAATDVDARALRDHLMETWAP
jgi:purine nucleosidase